jgi:hypothetical protein
VRRALVISFIFLVAAGLTLGPKFRDHSYVTRGNVEQLHRDLAALLAQRGFRTRIDDSVPIMQFVVAERGGCRLSVTNGVAGGSNLAPFVQFSQIKGKLHIYDDGRWKEELPQSSMLANRLLQRFAGQMGLIYEFRPALMIIAGESCSLAGIPWSNVRLRPVLVRRSAPGRNS